MFNVSLLIFDCFSHLKSVLKNITSDNDLFECTKIVLICTNPWDFEHRKGSIDNISKYWKMRTIFARGKLLCDGQAHSDEIFLICLYSHNILITWWFFYQNNNNSIEKIGIPHVSWYIPFHFNFFYIKRMPKTCLLKPKSK